MQKKGGWRTHPKIGILAKNKQKQDGEVDFGAADVSVVEGKAKKRKGDTGVIKTVTKRIITALRLFNGDFIATLGEVKKDVSALYYIEGNKAIIDIPVYPNKFDNQIEYHRVVLWELEELEGDKIEDYIKTAKRWTSSEHATAARRYNNKTVFLIIGKQLGKIAPGIWKRDIGKRQGTLIFHKYTKKGGFTDGRFIARRILATLADFFEHRVNRLAEVMGEKKQELFSKMAVIDRFLRRAIELFRDAKKAAALLYMWNEKDEAEYKLAKKYLDFFTEQEKKLSGG